MTPSIDLRPLGDQAWLASFADPDAAAAWHLAAERFRDRDGVTDVVLAYASVAVHYDATRLDPFALRDDLAAIERGPVAEIAARVIEIPTLYEGDDLGDVAARLGRSVDEVVSLHSGPTYHVFALGFLPGFPYCGFLPPELSGLPRRTEPRPRVPAGSVAIAGRQTGIYPAESPGGWHLLGRTPLRIVDLATGSFPIRPGDRLRFRPITTAEFEAATGRPLGLES